MKIGFIGAGKVGFTLGKYFAENNAEIRGYLSRNAQSAQKAAEFTGSKVFENVGDALSQCDVIFITTPDGQIENVWREIRNMPLENKIICHCSGSLSSNIFSEAGKAKVCSVHPLFAIHDKYTSYKEIPNAVFTLEGDADAVKSLYGFITAMGNAVEIIPAEKKAKYHAAAVMVSNLAVALYQTGADMLKDCGFDERAAEKALAPLFLGNAQTTAKIGAKNALTGPIERGDIKTALRHLKSLNGDERRIYEALSAKVTEIAEKKNPQRDYSKFKEVFK